MEERIITFQYEFDVTGKRVPVRAIQGKGDALIDCLDLTKILLEIEFGKNRFTLEEAQEITSNIIEAHDIEIVEEFYAQSGQGVEFLLFADQFSKTNGKEYERLLEWLCIWKDTVQATILERIGEHLAFAPLLHQHDKLLETEGIKRDNKQTLTQWLQSYCGILEASQIKLFNNKISRTISESNKATKQRQPEKNEFETKIYDRSEFCSILSMIRQIVYGDGFEERFTDYFYKLPKQRQSEENKKRSCQVRQKFYEYKDSGKLQNISEADLKNAIKDIWGEEALVHAGASQLPYSVDLFKRLLKNANITGRNR